MFTMNMLTQFLNQFDEDKHSKMLNIFITSLEKHEATCRNALSNKDAKILQSCTHDLKSLCYTLDANEQGKRAENIEAALIKGHNEKAFQHTPALLDDIAQIIDIMKKSL